MSKKAMAAGLLLGIVLQAGVLAGEYLGAVYPLWTGTEIRLRTVPVDPRSLFRGNYARLRYEISSIKATDLSETQDLRNGEIVYVKLKTGAGGLYELDGASLEKPDRGPFLRGRLQGTGTRRNGARYNVRYGIEACFAPKEKALALEKALRGTAVAVVRVAGSGRATLKEVITH